MKISKTHQRFSNLIEDPKALTNPEDYLGPNWKDVINFWLYIDILSEEEMDKMNNRYWSLDEDMLESSRYVSFHVFKEVMVREVIERYNNLNNTWRAAFHVTNKRSGFAHATRELIAHHKLLEQNKTLVALPICLNL
jgi:hypothetical protein